MSDGKQGPDGQEEKEEASYAVYISVHYHEPSKQRRLIALAPYETGHFPAPAGQPPRPLKTAVMDICPLGLRVIPYRVCLGLG